MKRELQNSSQFQMGKIEIQTLKRKIFYLTIFDFLKSLLENTIVYFYYIFKFNIRAKFYLRFTKTNFSKFQKF